MFSEWVRFAMRALGFRVGSSPRNLGPGRDKGEDVTPSTLDALAAASLHSAAAAAQRKIVIVPMRVDESDADMLAWLRQNRTRVPPW